MSVHGVARVSTAVTLALLLGGCTPGPHGSRAPTTSTIPSQGIGSVHLTDYALNTDGPESSAILTGALGDFGTGETVKKDDSAETKLTGQLKLTLRHGDFRIDIATLDARLAAAFRGVAFDPHTCSGTVTAHASAPIVAGSGTSAYAHLRGTFDLTVTVDEVDAPPCDGTGAFLQQTIIMAGTGTVTGSR